MKGKFVSPALVTAFSCPHCGTLAPQRWHQVYAYALSKDEVVDFHAEAETCRHYAEERDTPTNLKESLRQRADTIDAGVIDIGADGNHYARQKVTNLAVTQCYTCAHCVVWQGSRMISPSITSVYEPNEDLGESAKADFIEASGIVDISPRGAAALLRLCVQKLCAQLGESGVNINDDIASLVKKGLDSRIQKSLDIVRVIGNEAVHPGELDVRDDRATATKLFGLVNLIADALITQRKQIDEFYEQLPVSKLDAIKRRDSV